MFSNIPSSPREANYLRTNVIIVKDNTGEFFPDGCTRKINCAGVQMVNPSIYLSKVVQFNTATATPGPARFNIGDIVPTGYPNSVECVHINVPQFGSLYVQAADFNANFYNNCNSDCCTLPDCPDVTGAAMSAITATTATVSWTAAPANDDVAGYEWIVTESAIAPTGDGAFTDAVTVDIAGLTAATDYHFWIRTVCGSDRQSGWVSVAFTTTA